MGTKAVIGISYGDEGKGSTVDFLCSIFESPLIVRYSGGHQAAHTVHNINGVHTFSTFGSGTFNSAPTLILNSCVVSPVNITHELNALLVIKKRRVFDIKLYVHRDTPVTTPHEIRFNKDASAYRSHGTCGMGVGETIQREEDGFHLTFGDLYNPTVLKIKMDTLLSQRYNGYMDEKLAEALQHFYKCVKLIRNRKEIILVNDGYKIISNHKSFIDNTIIYESSQGLLLDPDIGFFPHVTRIPLSSRNIMSVDIDKYFVTRCYQTRHGNGPMTNEDKTLHIKDTPEEYNKDNEYQGKFRKTILDLDLLEYSLSKEEKAPSDKLVITCLDQLKKFQYTHKEILYEFDDIEDFILSITEILGFRRVILSFSPVGEEMIRKRVESLEGKLILE